MKRMVIALVAILVILIGTLVARIFWPRPSVAVITDGVYTNAMGQTCPWLLITNPFSSQITYKMLPPEVKTHAGWSKSRWPEAVILPNGKTYRQFQILGGDTLRPRSGFRFIAGDDPVDHRPYRYPVVWGIPPQVAATRPLWERKVDALAARWIGHPLFLPFGIARSAPILPQFPNQGGATNGSQSARRQVTFGGAVKAGEPFQHSFGGIFTFALEPSKFGWRIVVYQRDRKQDLARLTPPFHFVPNPTDIEGWHFRNEDNTGPNDGSVNAPQKDRKFIFSPEVGLSIDGSQQHWNVSPEQVEQVRAFGRGVLHINHLVLSPVNRGGRARILQMDFNCTVSWPAQFHKPTILKKRSGDPLSAEVASGRSPHF